MCICVDHPNLADNEDFTGFRSYTVPTAQEWWFGNFMGEDRSRPSSIGIPHSLPVVWANEITDPGREIASGRGHSSTIALLQ